MTDSLDWRCPRCHRLCNRLAVAGDASGVVIEHKCDCNEFSTASVEGGALVVKRGRLPYSRPVVTEWTGGLG